MFAEMKSVEVENDFITFSKVPIFPCLVVADRKNETFIW